MVIDVRRRDKEEASKKTVLCREALEKATIELRRREDALSAHREEIAGADQNLRGELEKGAAASSILSHKVYIEGLRETETVLIQEIESQNLRVIEAENDLEKALRILTEASRELSVIEKHKKKWQTAEQKRVTKQEQKLLDEVSSILHERTKKL